MGYEDFHPDLRGIARWLPRSPVSQRTLKTVRALQKVPRQRSRNVEIVPVGDVTARLHRPAVTGRPVPGLLWIHGGGMVIGNAAEEDRTCRLFADELGIAVVAVDYRVAPENPFPIPLHDCYDALAWLTSQPEVDASRIAIGGASAGGGLAASLALLARDRGEISPIFQLLVYPMLDDRTAARTDLDETNIRLWSNKTNWFGWESYIGLPPGSPGVSGLAAPARHDNLTDLPPAWIGVGTLDLFYDEAVAYAQRLNAAGVKCELETVPGAFHGFDVIRPKAQVTRTFQQAQVAALRDALR